LPVSRCSSSRGTNSSRAPIGDRPEGGDDRRRDEVAGQVELAPAGRDDAVAGSLLARGDVARDGRLVDHRAGERAAGVRQPAGSSIAVVATDAPLAPAQLTRLARRAGLGLGRSGSVAHHGSGEIVLASTTAGRRPRDEFGSAGNTLPDAQLDPLFAAAVDAGEEADLNARSARRPTSAAARAALRAGSRAMRCSRWKPQLDEWRIPPRTGHSSSSDQGAQVPGRSHRTELIRANPPRGGVAKLEVSPR
jgi:hypothetical protein